MWEVIFNILLSVLTVSIPVLIAGITSLNKTMHSIDNRINLLEQSENMNKTFIERLPCSAHVHTINKNASDLEIAKRDIVDLKNIDTNFKTDVKKLYEDRNSIMLLLQDIKGEIALLNSNFNNLGKEITGIKVEIKDIQKEVKDKR